jgi:hypothetical protein
VYGTFLRRLENLVQEYAFARDYRQRSQVRVEVREKLLAEREEAREKLLAECEEAKVDVPTWTEEDHKAFDDAVNKACLAAIDKIPTPDPKTEVYKSKYDTDYGNEESVSPWEREFTCVEALQLIPYVTRIKEEKRVAYESKVGYCMTLAAEVGHGVEVLVHTPSPRKAAAAAEHPHVLLRDTCIYCHHDIYRLRGSVWARDDDE